MNPGNNQLMPGERVKLVDFGISRFFKQAQEKDTVSFGTPGYAAPEQYGMEQTGPAADIYGLGVTLHTLLTGHDPAAAPFNIPPAGSLNPAVSARVSEALSKAIHTDPRSRYQSALEFWSALAPGVYPPPPVSKRNVWNRLFKITNILRQ
jgi:serine/threonine-protein kinase